jgi:Pyruvate/2-oxoacid:ferredoxin oxidoreductase delta subunit
MVPFIDKRKCAAQSFCPPIQSCPNQAVSYIEDKSERLGGRIEIDLEKCEGCGKCVEVCCGHCIELRDN